VPTLPLPVQIYKNTRRFAKGYLTSSNTFVMERGEKTQGRRRFPSAAL